MDLINELNSLRKEEALRATCLAVLNGMIKYAQMHFDAEEYYSEKSAYPDSLEHKKAHETFVEETFCMAQDLDEDMLTLSGVTIYLQEWYEDHILGIDQEYKPFAAQRPLKSDDAPQSLRPPGNSLQQPITSLQFRGAEQRQFPRRLFTRRSS